MSELNASNRLMEMTFEAVNEALNSLRASQSFVPFIMTITKEGYVLRRFREQSLLDAIERAKKVLANEDEDTLAYALVYDAVIEIDETKYDAIMLETGERPKAEGWRFVQRYRPIGKNLIQAIGELAYLGVVDSYLV